MRLTVCWVLILLLTVAAGSPAAAQGVRQIPREQLLEQANNKIAEQLGGVDYEVQPPPNIPDSITVPAGDITIRAEIPYGIRYNTPTLVSLIITSTQGYSNTIGLSFIIRKFERVVVAAQDIAVNEPLHAGNLRYERRTVSNMAQGYKTDIRQIIQLVPKQRITAGMVINDYMLRKPIIIKRGQMINIVARLGNIEVGALGQAMQNGSNGQLIRVRNLNSKKTVVAKVIDGTTVMVFAK